VFKFFIGPVKFVIRLRGTFTVQMRI